MAKEKLPIEALLRRWREEEEARLEAERYRAAAAEFERTVKAVRCVFPGDLYSIPDSRGPLARAAEALIERLFGGS